METRDRSDIDGTEDDFIEQLVAYRNKCTNQRAQKTFRQASKFCRELLATSEQTTAQLLRELGDFGSADICFVAVGSVGRDEALQASDLDLVPVCANDQVLAQYEPLDQQFRRALSEALNLKVSAGSDLTRPISVEKLIDPETIGGDKDDSSALTRRLLVLTESKSAGGGLCLEQVRESILGAYAESPRTRGRHVLSLCNDICRYYRTLCIEYKAKIDIEDKDWCTRNLKLRHSRKLWYFSSMMAIVALADTHPDGQGDYMTGLLRACKLPPSLRIIHAVSEGHRRIVGDILNRFAWFLEYMSDEDRRHALAEIDHDRRYSIGQENPFPMMKLNSDALHGAMSKLILEQEAHARQRVIDWFLL